jgi:hypothetical protein
MVGSFNHRTQSQSTTAPTLRNSNNSGSFDQSGLVMRAIPARLFSEAWDRELPIGELKVG